jgi:hypothetical protein
VGWAGGEGVGPSRIWAGSGKRERKGYGGLGCKGKERRFVCFFSNTNTI